MKQLLLFLTLLSTLFAFEQEAIIENSTFITGTSDYVLDYNRLRLNYQAHEGDFSAHVIIDHDIMLSDIDPTILLSTFLNYATDIPFETSHVLSNDPYNRLKLYRAYVKYEGEKHTLNLGLQRVAFGVGRLWTPTDMFNPLNSLSLESSERAPVLAAYYNYALNETASITTVVSQQKSKDFKGAFRIKGNLSFGDAALLYIQEANRRMYGYELEGELFKTGVEMRSEGGYYTDIATQKSYTKLLVGADYAFENSLMVIFEYLYNENDATALYEPISKKYYTLPDAFSDVIAHRDQHYGAAMLSYELSTLWNLAGFIMSNLEDQSFIVAPSLSYSISNEASFLIGGFLSSGADDAEFATGNNVIFLSYSMTF